VRFLWICVDLLHRYPIYSIFFCLSHTMRFCVIACTLLGAALAAPVGPPSVADSEASDTSDTSEFTIIPMSESGQSSAPAASEHDSQSTESRPSDMQTASEQLSVQSEDGLGANMLLLKISHLRYQITRRRFELVEVKLDMGKASTICRPAASHATQNRCNNGHFTFEVVTNLLGRRKIKVTYKNNLNEFQAVRTLSAKDVIKADIGGAQVRIQSSPTSQPTHLSADMKLNKDIRGISNRRLFWKQ